MKFAEDYFLLCWITRKLTHTGTPTSVLVRQHYLFSFMIGLLGNLLTLVPHLGVGTTTLTILLLRATSGCPGTFYLHSLQSLLTFY